MDTRLLKIIPGELKFTFELKKQSSCSVQLVNNSDQYVAFKVKTTNPKKYCVRPNVGVIHPNATCDFTVTMQAQRVVPPELQCKDKFLIQGTIVPYGTAEDAIPPDMFAKDSGNYLEETKLKVVLTSPPLSPVLLPANGVLKEDNEPSNIRDQVLTGVENLPRIHKVAKDEEHFKLAKNTEEMKPTKDVGGLKQTKFLSELKKAKDVESKLAEDVPELKPAKAFEGFKPAKALEGFRQNDGEEVKLANHVEFKVPEDLKPAKAMEEIKQIDEEELKLAKPMAEAKLSKRVEELNPLTDIGELQLAKEVEDLKLKLKDLEAKLSGAETTIAMLREERSTTIGDRQTLEQQMTMLRKKNGVRRDQVGYPFLFVCMVALIGFALGSVNWDPHLLCLISLVSALVNGEPNLRIGDGWHALTKLLFYCCGCGSEFLAEEMSN
ncbi:Vesicle-associated protein 1-1 [Thalictrum thalictroides]|uniref:Vesicle-associated protein 1-1 n=1 Tax=Thalictrum thalictroides TaxID=46969 RepID=A0A7J6WH44_THATH|nr:Vesicle-associated protein 1-1 [Thalictrum thalictroides]